jgi:flagellar biosynthesis/type III secretory pathway protein FliH
MFGRFSCSPTTQVLALDFKAGYAAGYAEGFKQSQGFKQGLQAGKALAKKRMGMF